MKNIFLFIFLSNTLIAQNSYKILHYSETSGYDHQTRANSFSMFQQFTFSGNSTIIHDTDGSEFNSLSNLQTYDLIVFSNTSGSSILDSTQRANFEQYIANGGNLLGMHAASDTYRHSTANGSPSGVWDFYAETLGGSVQQAPNHVSGTPVYDISKIGAHPSTVNLPNPWSKAEEYYYWENGYLDSAINVVLEVEQTVGPNGMVNAYDSARAVSWYKQLNSGSRIFYTSMGHANNNYTSDTLFQDHIFRASRWCMGLINKIEEHSSKGFELFPNPVNEQLVVNHQFNDVIAYEIINGSGRTIISKSKLNLRKSINVEEIDEGVYFLRIKTQQGNYIAKFIKQ